MALYFNLNRCLCRYSRLKGNNLYKCYVQQLYEKSVALDVDTINDFTSQLMQKKTDKWSAEIVTLKLTNKTNINKSQNFNHTTCIKDLSIEKINNIFQEFIEAGDNCATLDLVMQCIKYDKCPSFSHIIYVLTHSAQNGDKTMILQIKDFYQKCHPDTLKANSDFQHYLAEAIWIKGNISESLRLFKKVYEENAYLRRKIRLTFKYLVTDVISNRSEGALISIVKFSEDLLKNYEDFFPLICIWQVCFLSEWYADQCLALKLVEDNLGLVKAISNRIPYVVGLSLNRHRTEVVYRLLEVLLKYEMKLEYTGVLLALLDYQVRHGDIRSCSEIIYWATKYNVDLPTINHEKFLNVLLRYNIEVDKLKTSRQDDVNTHYKF